MSKQNQHRNIVAGLAALALVGGLGAGVPSVARADSGATPTQPTITQTVDTSAAPKSTSGWVWHIDGTVVGTCAAGYSPQWNEITDPASKVWGVHTPGQSPYWQTTTFAAVQQALAAGSQATFVAFEMGDWGNGLVDQAETTHPVGYVPAAGEVDEGDCVPDGYALPTPNDHFTGGGDTYPIVSTATASPSPEPTSSTTPSPSAGAATSAPTSNTSNTPTSGTPSASSSGSTGTAAPSAPSTSPSTPSTRRLDIEVQIDTWRLHTTTQAATAARVLARPTYAYRADVVWNQHTGHITFAPLWARGVSTPRTEHITVTVPTTATAAQVLAAEKQAAARAAGIPTGGHITPHAGHTVTAAYLVPTGAWDARTDWHTGPHTGAQVLAAVTQR